MEKKVLNLEHSNMMYFSQELIQMHKPVEIDVIVYSLLILFCLIGIALPVVQINDLKKVNGIVKTKENISTIKNIVSGKIDKIYYTPGQLVQKGEVLYSLDKEIYETKNIKLEIEESEIKKQMSCIDILLQAYILEKRDKPQNADELVVSQIEEYFATIDYFKEQIGIYEFKYFTELNQPAIMLNERNVEEARRNLNLARKELEKYKANYSSNLYSLKNEYELKLAKINQEKKEAEEEIHFLDIKAPVNGYIQEISSLNSGDYIFSNQNVLNIIPNESKNFRVEMSVSAKDIGEIIPGMKVKYRLSAFPFFEYKGAQGKILSIDSDVRQSGDGRLFYQVYGDIDRVAFTNRKGDEYPLKAGIDVDARIVMEKITLMQFFLRKLDFIQ